MDQIFFTKMAGLLGIESECAMKTLRFCGIYFKSLLNGLVCKFMCFT